jgi:2-polyprenyl-3-methyl-5-hydroxy-6-metoxy-1,4-benzoquinol methylase
MDHARRTAQDSAAFLLPHIQPHHKILDVGCGPGTIAADLAALVPQGSVIAVDAVESVLQQASTYAASRNLTNISFQTVDANDLPFPDDTFDIVYCHQLLQHVKDPGKFQVSKFKSTVTLTLGAPFPLLYYSAVDMLCYLYCHNVLDVVHNPTQPKPSSSS